LAIDSRLLFWLNEMGKLQQAQSRSQQHCSAKSMLEEMKALLKPHSGGKESIDEFFNRQLHERIVGMRLDQPLPNVRLLRLSEDEVTVSEEFWSNAQLKAFHPWHRRKNLPNATCLSSCSEVGVDYASSMSKAASICGSTRKTMGHTVFSSLCLVQTWATHSQVRRTMAGRKEALRARDRMDC
jgi:hypothetical protein